MSNAKVRNVFHYVVPTIMSGVCFFLFTIVDAVFVGRGVGTDALGAMNLIGPFVMLVGAVNMLINIGGVAIFAIRIGKGDIDGANKVFRNGMFLLLCVSAVLSFIRVLLRMVFAHCWGPEKPIIIWQPNIYSGTPSLLSLPHYPRGCKAIAEMMARLGW